MFDYTKTDQVGLKRETLSPHPDGQAWPKCCKELPYNPALTGGSTISCAFVHMQPHGARLSAQRGSLVTSYDSMGSHVVKYTPFMCVHRTTEDGHHRVCAGWDACFGNKAIKARGDHG